MEDILQEPCPKGGKHELVFLQNIYSIVCSKCGMGWSKPYTKDDKHKSYLSESASSKKDEEE